MKRLVLSIGLVALSVSSVCAAPLASPTPASPWLKKHPAKPIVPHVVFLKFAVAPADEYFGRLKLSILGIRNTIKDAGLKADADPAHAASLMGGIAMTEDAMHDWEKKYPHDSWIPTAIFTLERFYAKVDTDDARSHAKFAMNWLVHDYPETAVAKTGRKELQSNLVGVKPAPAVVPSDALAGAPVPAAPNP